MLKSIRKKFFFLLIISITISPYIFSQADTVYLHPAEINNSINYESCEYSIFKINPKNSLPNVLVNEINPDYFKNNYKFQALEVSEFKCINKILNIEDDVIFIGQNFKYLEIFNLFNIFFIFYIFYLNKTHLVKNLIIYLVFNIGIRYFFLSGFNFIPNILFPYIHPNSDLIDYFVNNLYLSAFVAKINLKKLNFIFYLYFIFYNIDFLSFFILFQLIVHYREEKNINLEKLNYEISKFTLGIPIIFYITRLYSGYSKFNWSDIKSIDNLWLLLGQNNYNGYGRYADLEWVLRVADCNYIKYNSPDCFFENGEKVLAFAGPLDIFISFSNNPKDLTLILGSIFIVFTILTYLILLNYFPRYKYIIFVMFLSPPLNFLTFMMNVDFIVILVAYSALYFYKKNIYVSHILLTFITLYKLHPIGLLIGLLFYSILIDDRKSMRINFISLSFSSMVILYHLVFIRSKVMGSTLRIRSYGILNDSEYLEYLNLLSKEMSYVLILLVLLSVAIYLFKAKPINYENLIQLNIYLLPPSIWFCLTVLYSNQSYRLPIFYVLFAQLFNKNSFLVKLLVINTILLTPSVNTLPILLKSIFININIFSIYLLFIVFVLNYIKLFDNKVLKNR